MSIAGASRARALQMIRNALVRFARVAAIMIAAGAASLVPAQDVLSPNPHLKVEGIPPIPAALAAQVALYTEFRPRSLASWHPVKRELVVATRATNTAQLFDVKSPLGPLAQITDYAEPVRYGTWWPAKPDVLVFARDAGGNEQRQIYRLDPGAKDPMLLTDPARVNQPAGMTRARDRLLVTVHRRRQDERPARKPDPRPHADRSARTGQGRERSLRCPAPAGATSRSRSTTGGSRWPNSSRSPRAMSG